MHIDSPEEHPSLGSLPFYEAAEVVFHRTLEDVALLAVEICDELGVRLEGVIAP